MGSIPESFIPLPLGRPGRIAIFSDSHGNMRSFSTAIRLAEERGPIDAALHLGDFTADAALLGELAPNWPAFVVRGNNDYNDQETPNELLLRIGERTIYMTHGHHYPASVRSLKLAERGRSMDADVICYGHTHIVKIENIDGSVVINPGSVSYPRDGREPSFVLLEISEKLTAPEIIFFPRP